MKKLFLSSSFGYNWNQINTWNKSAKNTGHDVCNLLINLNDQLVKDCLQNGVGVVPYHLDPRSTAGKPPHNLRFLLQYKYLMSVKDKYSHVILTDSRDVYFHEDPFPMLQSLMTANNCKVVCGSESILYSNESWNLRNLQEGYGYVFDEYKDTEVKNVGILCGETKAIAELCLLIFTMCIHNPASVSDQSSFNILMELDLFSEKIHTCKLSDGFVVHLAVTGVDKFQDKLIEKPSWKKDELPKINGKVYPIIHQYDRVEGMEKNFVL